MLRFLILFTLINVGANLLAQPTENIDSLEQDLAARPLSDTARFNTLVWLWEYHSYRNLETGLEYARQMLKESRLRERPYEIADAKKCLSVSHGNLGNLDSALLYTDQAMKEFRELGEEYQIAILLYNRGYDLYDLGKIDSAQSYLRQAGEIFEEMDKLMERGAVANMLAAIHQVKGENWQAMEQSAIAMDLAEKSSDSLLLGYARFKLAEAHMRLSDYEPATRLLLANVGLYERRKRYNLLASSFTSLSKLYHEKGDLSEALELAQKANDLSAKHDHPVNKLDALNRLGGAHKELGELENAERYLLEAAEGAGEIAIPDIQAESLLQLCEVRTKLGKLTLANQNGRKALELIKAMGDIVDMPRVLAALADNARARGAYSDAADYLTQRQVFQDSLYQVDLAASVADLTLKYERERKDRQLIEQANQLQLYESQAKADRLQKTLLLVGLIFATAILVFFLYSRRQRRLVQQLERERLEDRIQNQQKELSSHALQMARKGELLDQIGDELRQVHGERPDDRKKLDGLLKELGSEERIDQDWANFRTYFQGVHQNFEERLAEGATSKLSPREYRLSALIRMQLNNQEVGAILGVSQDTLYKAKYRLRKKLPEAEEGGLDEFIRGL